MNTTKQLYQWDINQMLVDCTGLYVDFPINGEIYRVETKDGECLIPDEFLQVEGRQKIWECMPDCTRKEFVLEIKARPMPPDYAFTPTEKLTFDGLVKRVDDAIADMIRRADSGEFDGYTPVKGKDYFTADEIKQIQDEVSSGAVGDFKQTVDTVTDAFNINAANKVDAYDANAGEKLDAYNQNAESMLSAYNNNADSKIAEYDEHTSEYAAEIESLKSDLGHLENDVTVKKITSENVFDENWDMQGYKLVNGEIVEDSNYMCTSNYYQFNAEGMYLIQTSVGIAFSVHFYDSNKTFLGTKNLGSNLSGSVACPVNSAFFRCTVLKSENWNVAIGYSAFTEYIPYSFKYLLNYNVLSERVEPIYYQIDTFTAGGEQVRVASKYDANNDIINRLWTRIRGNRFFDFSQTLLNPNTSITVSSDFSSATVFNSNETEWHSPFKVVADNNADGDCAADNKFTGGSHDYTNGSYTGTATQRLAKLKYFADGREVKNGDSGRCFKFEIHWTNYVQGSNTEKSDGSGREILQENHRLLFDGIEWKDYVELVALEDLHIKLWYGLQMAGVKICYPNYRFVGDSNTSPATSPDALISGGHTCNKIICWGDDHRLEVGIDISSDLGRRLSYQGNMGAFHEYNTNKCYFTIINSTDGIPMTEGQMYTLNGYYRFMPNN